MNITIEQERAKYAFDKANTVPLEHKKSYKSYVKNLPMLIKSSGFGSAMAFVFVKSKKETEKAYEYIYNHIKEHLEKMEIVDRNDKGLAENIVNLDTEKYRYATLEVLELLKWSRRFAEGLCPPDNINNNEG